MPRTVFLDVNETLSDPAAVAPALTAVGADATTPAAWLAATLHGCLRP